MLKKQFIAMLVLTVACGLLSACGTKEASTAQNTSIKADTSSTESAEIENVSVESPDEFDKMQLADDKIEELTSSEKYKDASKEERYTLVSDLLESLEAEGSIKNLAYFEEDELFSFQYENGVLGGVSLDDFSTKPGELPVN